MADKKTDKPPRKPALTDTERHQRSKDMAREIGADEDPASFDRAFAEVAAPSEPDKPE